MTIIAVKDHVMVADSWTWRGGINDAYMLAEGAMLAGMSAVNALALVIARCAYVGGAVQVESL